MAFMTYVLVCLVCLYQQQDHICVSRKRRGNLLLLCEDTSFLSVRDTLRPLLILIVSKELLCKDIKKFSASTDTGTLLHGSAAILMA